MRDDLDSPYVVHERDSCWSSVAGFTEQCLCYEATDATHYHSPQDAHSVDSDAAASPDDPSAITLAIEVLRHINDWATLDPEGERYPWIAARTADALAALAGVL